MDKQRQRKESETYNYEREERSRHFFKLQKRQESRKQMRDLDNVLRSKDYTRLVQSDDY